MDNQCLCHPGFSYLDLFMHADCTLVNPRCLNDYEWRRAEISPKHLCQRVVIAVSMCWYTQGFAVLCLSNSVFPFAVFLIACACETLSEIRHM